MLDVIGPLREAGFALHWLVEREKRPIEAKWSDAPVYSVEELRKKYRAGMNLGVRLGEPSRIGDLYLHTLDVDIRVADLADEAFDALYEMLPEFDSFPEVASGSGGESRHFYFLSDKPFRSRKLAHSEGFFVDAKGHKHWNWEIELFGTGKQVVLPPSIHPDTGKPYVWIREFDLDLVGLGLGPFVSADRMAALAPADTDDFDTDDDDADFLAEVYGSPIADVTPDKVRDTLALLPLPAWCEDRDGWRTTGAALHHQFGGGEAGFKLWCDFSRQSTKFNEKDQRRVWKSFDNNRRGARVTTFRTLLQAANVEKARRRAEAEEIDDLIGEVSSDDGLDETAKRDWTTLLDRNEEGALKTSLHNTRLIVGNDLRTKGLPMRNLFTQEIVQRTSAGTAAQRVRRGDPKPVKNLSGQIWNVHDPVNGDLWSDARDYSIRDLVEAPGSQGGYGLKLSDRDLRAAISLMAHERSFHPVREYLSGQQWDGRERVETLFIDYMGAPDDAYHRSIARVFLVSAVARVFEPGHKFDFAIILEGLQGKGKSTFIRTLARHWFAELDGDFHDPKGMVELMQGSWILELPELVGFGKADIRQIKAFISRQTDKVRLAYERRAAEFHRQCVFIGSTNDLEYLRDETGGRRFWPVHCAVASIDTARLEREVDQVWAEAYAIYLTMRAEQPKGTLPLYLTKADAAQVAAMLQESRRVESAEDGMAGRISEWLESPIHSDEFESEPPAPREVTCLMEIWVDCLKRDVASYGQAQAQQLGRAMRKVDGWLPVNVRRLPKWGPQRAYIRDFRLD